MTRSKVRHVASLAVAGIALTGAIGVTATTAAAPAQAAPGSIGVITHNIAKNDTALSRVITKAANMPGPQVVLVQEVCQSMLPRLDALGPTAFHPRRTNQADCSDKVIGEAVVFSKKGLAAQADSVDFAVDGQDDQTYGMACLTFMHAGRTTRACSTHLAAGKGDDRDAVRLATTREMRTKVRAWKQHDVVIIGGDFNSQPGERAMNRLYGVGPRAEGDFREISQTAGAGNTRRDGRATFYRKKIDYVFVAKTGSRASGGTVDVAPTASDHRMLFGKLPLS